MIEPYEAYVQQRLSDYPELSIARLLREIRELGYPGGKTMLGDFVREVRPAAAPLFEVRFETAPDFLHTTNSPHTGKSLFSHKGLQFFGGA